MTDYAKDASGANPLHVAVYIDGFNVYHGLMDKGWGRFRWLDYRRVAERFIRPPQELWAVKYFTSLVTHDRPGLKRQNQYLQGLKTQGGITVHLGSFEKRSVKCTECDQWYKRNQEKRTDVNIATHLVADAHDNLYGSIYLVSADADLTPAVEHIKSRFGTHVTLIDPPRRHSDDLKSICDRHLHIDRTVFSQCQLPNPVERRISQSRTRRYYRPAERASDPD